MTQKLTYFLIAIVFIGSKSLAVQEHSEEINIREILQQQISEIKNKQDMANVNLAFKNSSKEDSFVKTADVRFQEKAMEGFSKSIAVKVFVLAEVSLLTSLFFLWIRRTKKIRKDKLSILKSNIKDLREERIGSIHELRLTNLRNRLRSNPIKINNKGRDITTLAKKHNIAKGEVHLAAKIKLLTGEYR